MHKSKINSLSLKLFLCSNILIGTGGVVVAETNNITSPEDLGETPFIPSTPPPSETPTPTPTPPPPTLPPSTPPPTPLPTPTPQPTPEVCKYISGSINDRGTKHGKYYGNIFEKSGDSSKFGCIDSLINQVKSSAKNWHQYWNDDSYANTLASIVFPDRNGNSVKVGVHSNGAVCDRNYNGDVPGGKKYCGVGRFFMDANTCQIIPAPNGKECAKFELNYLKGCPVSLIWEKGREHENKSTVVQFSLGNNKTDWTIWKGSDIAPLLVFDPEHKGNIHSSEQLFGEWAFGGKKLATLGKLDNTNVALASASTPWKDGYEALSTLDLDKNGKIAGKELDVLALWFDKNQNAVSETGEVKSATSLGITSIYYKSKKDDGKGNLFIENGFERKVGKKIESGKSIDWYSKISKSPIDLINLTISEKTFEELAIDNVSETGSSGLLETEQLSGDPSKFSGLWKWRVSANSKVSEDIGGYLTFARADVGGNLIGFSINEVPLEISPQENIKTGSSIFAFDGFESEVNGRKKITFKSEYNGNTLVSVAHLSEGDQVMNGKTIVKGSSNGEKIETTYYWTAEKE